MSFLFDLSNDRLTGTLTSGYDISTSGLTLGAWVKKASWTAENSGIFQFGATALTRADSCGLFNQARANCIASVVRESDDASLTNTTYDWNETKTDDFVDGDVTVGTDLITLTGHPFADNDIVRLTTTGTLPTGLATATTYFVKSVDANTISLYSDYGLTSIVDITDAAGGGTHTVTLDYSDVWVFVTAIFNSNDTDRRVCIQKWANADTTSVARTTGTFDEILLGNFLGGTTIGWGGYIAEPCIWNTALSETDVNALQTGHETGPAPNTIQSGSVVSYWTLKSADTNNGRDNVVTGNGGDLTVGGEAASDASHPTITDSGITIEVPTGPWR
jgi:hypothetical protein